MAGDSDYLHLGAVRCCGGAVRILCVFLAVLFFSCIPREASGQLPGSKKPEEFTPVIPDFSKPPADWWSAWDGATLEQRREWLKALSEAWEKHRERLPEDEALQKQANAISETLKRIESTWQKREEYRKSPVLEGVEFPENPDVLDWAKVDAEVSRGRERLSSLDLEAEQLDESLDQSNGNLSRRVLDLREAKEGGKPRETAAQELLLAQLEHLNLVEQKEILTEQRDIWTEQIELAGEELEHMLDSLHFSMDVQKSLNETIEKERAKNEKLDDQRVELQGKIDVSADPDANLRKDLKFMEVEMAQLESAMEIRKNELLLSINSALKEDGERVELATDRELDERSRAVIEKVSGELRLRLQQVAAWRGKESGNLNRWWPYFDEVYSGLLRARAQLDDIARYQQAELHVFKAHQGQLATVRERIVYHVDNILQHWRELANYPLFAIARTPITLRQIAKIILVLLFAWLVSALMRRVLARLVLKKRASESSMYNLGRVLHYSIIAIALLVALAMLGLDTSKLALVAGALSVGIGFGLQAIFSNFISGLILLFEQPLRVGDLVELESGVFGRIRDINVRSTRITTRDNVDILVPNSEFVSGRVINHTLDDPVRRIHVSFGVAYNSDPDLVREAAIEAAERVDITHSDWQRKTEVWLMEFGDSSLNFKLVVWIDSNMITHLGDPHALYNIELLKEFRERGIEVPFPQRELHLRSWDPALFIERKRQS